MADEALRGDPPRIPRAKSSCNHALSTWQGILVNLGEKDDNKRKKAARLKFWQQKKSGTLLAHSTLPLTKATKTALH